MARRRLTIDESLRVLKFFYQFLIVRNGAVLWAFWEPLQEAFTANATEYNLAELQDTPAPYLRSLRFLEVLMVTIISYMSSGNLHVPGDIWVADPGGGNKEAAKEALVAAVQSAPGSVAAMKEACRFILDAAKWVNRKLAAGDILVRKYNILHRHFKSVFYHLDA